MVSKNTTHLAGEFLVAGELARRGYPVSITLGNAKSVDIYAETKHARAKVDAKAGRGKSNWPISHVENDVYYIFVYLRNPSEIRENVPPQYFVISGEEILKKKLIKDWGTRRGITYKSLKNYEDNWHILEPPPQSL